MRLHKIWKYTGLLCCMLFFFSQSATAEDLMDSWWQKGNYFYARQQYDSALSYYQKIETEGGQTADLFYNMGNVFYRQGETGLAVLYYEKALFKAPQNPKIKDNLALAKERVVLPMAPASQVFFLSWWQKFKRTISPQVWAWVMLLCFLAALGLCYKKIKDKEAVPYLWRWMALFTGGIAASGIFFYASYQARTFTNKAVVMTRNAPFFSKPDTPVQTPDGALPEGAVVMITKEQNGRTAVELPNGNHVWVVTKDIRRVQPQ